MRLSPGVIEHISTRIVRGLAQENLIDFSEEPAIAGAVSAAFAEDLAVEDRLNDEVRELLRSHSDEMVRQGVQYHEMFRMIKSELVRKRKLIL